MQRAVKVMPKAHIGMSGPELVDEYVDEVAIYDLHKRLRDAKEEHGEEWGELKTINMTTRGLVSS